MRGKIAAALRLEHMIGDGVIGRNGKVRPNQPGLKIRIRRAAVHLVKAIHPTAAHRFYERGVVIAPRAPCVETDGLEVNRDDVRLPPLADARLRGLCRTEERVERARLLHHYNDMLNWSPRTGATG
jgi:hypothetical protein